MIDTKYLAKLNTTNAVIQKIHKQIIPATRVTQCPSNIYDINANKYYRLTSFRKTLKEQRLLYKLTYAELADLLLISEGYAHTLVNKHVNTVDAKVVFAAAYVFGIPIEEFCYHKDINPYISSPIKKPSLFKRFLNFMTCCDK